MKALLFSDIHDSNRGLWLITDFLKKNREISGLVFAGDLVNMGEPISFAEKFIAEISKFNLPLLWVPGNNDFGESYKVLQNHTPSLEGRIVEFGGRRFTGVGGSPASWESQYQGEASVKKEDIAGTIFMSHYPPAGVKYFTQNPNSKIQIPNKFQNPNVKISDAPIAHICGHIHHTWGVGRIGETKVIKLASLELGYLAIMELDTLEVEFMRLL